MTHTRPRQTAEGRSCNGDAAATHSLDALRWNAVLAREPQADGVFVFAVTSTGIYCRPSCPARRPRRENVRFYATAKAAENAGFRACRRCTPDQHSPHDALDLRIAEACRSIEGAEEMPSLATLASAAGFSPSHFHRRFAALVGATPAAYARFVRAERVRNALASSPSVTAAALDAGFASNGRFYAAAEEVLGMSPKSYRAGGKGEEIVYACAACSLGRVLVATTQRGLCAVLLGDGDAALAAELMRRLPSADLRCDATVLADVLERVVAMIEAPSSVTDVPLDVRGTAFQQRVWQALATIPPGETMSYAALASRIGAPTATRAVASACGANPLAVVIPCHRVVGADGRLTGYRWGVERKQALLEREKTANPQARRKRTADKSGSTSSRT